MPLSLLPTARILWVANVVSLLIFGLVLQLAKPPPGEGIPYFLHALPALLCAGLSQVLPGYLARAPTPPGAPPTRGMTPFIVRMALIEGSALFGFVDAWLTGDPLRYAPFWAVAFALQLLAFPLPEDPVRDRR